MNRQPVIALIGLCLLLLSSSPAGAQDTVYVQGNLSFDYDQWPFGGINGSFQAEGVIDENTGLPIEGNSGVGGGLLTVTADTTNAMVFGVVLNDNGTVNLTGVAVQFTNGLQPGDYPVDVENLTAGFVYLDQVSNFTIPENDDFMAWFNAIEANAKYVSTSGNVHVDQVDGQYMVGSFSGMVADPSTFVMLSVDNGVFSTDNDIAVVSVPDAPGPLAMKGWPNPFNPMTTVSFTLPEAGSVEVAIFDLTGRRVRSLHSGQLESGDHSFHWNGTNDQGARQAAGQYFCRVRSSAASSSLKLLLVP